MTLAHFERWRIVRNRDPTRLEPVGSSPPRSSFRARSALRASGGNGRVCSTRRPASCWSAIATEILLAAMVWWHASLLAEGDRSRTQALAALRDSEERLRELLDNANALIHLKDLDGRLLFINRRCEQLFHVPRAQALGRRYDDFFPGPRSPRPRP